MQDIKTLLIRILKSEFDSKDAFIGKVLEVNGNLAKIESLSGKGIYNNIRIQANPGNGVLIIPSEESYVVVGRLVGNAGYIALTSSVDSIQLMDGSYGGLIKINELVDKLNVLEQRMTVHQHLSAAPGSPTTLDPATNPDIIETTVADLENDKITHGTV